MRLQFQILTQLVAIGLIIVAMGCNSDPRCRRETALLRAEILDLEDKFYMVKSERDQAIAQLRGNSVSGNVIIDDDPIYYGSDAGDVIYSESNDSNYRQTDQIYLQAPQSQAFESQPIYSDEIQMDGGAPYVDDFSLNPDEVLGTSQSDYLNLEISEPETISPLGDNLPAIDELLEPGSVIDDGQSGTMLNAPQNNSSGRDSITEIVIDRSQSQGKNLDGQQGDEGLDLLIKTKSFNGETILQAGALTVSVMDPTQPAAQQRIGLWKFTDEETELFFADQNPQTRGILLHLPWDQSIPTNKQVVVFVRFQTPDGRRLETSSQIWIDPPAAEYDVDDPLIAGWTQRDQRWVDSNGQRFGEPLGSIASQSANQSGPRKRVKAIQASTGSNRIEKPNWRPVR